MQVFNFVSHLLFLIISCTHLITATVTLTADYTGNICTNTIAVFTCISSTNVLFWRSSSGSNHFFKASRDSPNDTSTVGDFKVKLISKSGGKIISTATINALTDGISITCRDDISGGNSASKTIELASAPSKPLNFINTTTTFNSVSLSWSPPSSTGGTNLDHYIITVDPLPETGVCPDNQCRVISNDTILTDLMYGTIYNVTIKAVNCAGSGPIETLILTIVGQEPFPPQKLDVCVHGNNGNHELRVFWMCSDLFSLLVPPITNYEITLSSSNTSPTRINVLPSSNCSCSCSIDIPVEAMSLYSVSVSANNSVGSSINNPMVTVFTSAKLTTTTVIQTATSAVVAVNISWQSCIGSQAMLQLNYTHNTWSKMETFTTTLPAQTTYIPLMSLQSGTSYNLSVDLVTNGITVGSLTGDNFMTERLDNIVPAECSSIVVSQSQQTVMVSTIITTTMIITPSIVTSQSQEAVMVSTIVTTREIITPSIEPSVEPQISQSQEGVMVSTIVTTREIITPSIVASQSQQAVMLSTIVMTTNTITPSIEPNVDSQCPNNGNSIFSIGIFGVIAVTAVVSAIVLIVCLFCISKSYKKRQLYSKNKTTGQHTTNLNSSKNHLVQSNILNNASYQLQVNQSYGHYTNNQAMNVITELNVRPHNELPLVTTNPIYAETPNNTSQPTQDEITTDPVYLTSSENGNPVYIVASQGIPSPLTSPVTSPLPISITNYNDNPSYSKPYMMVFESPNVGPQGYITPVPIYEEIGESV